MKALRLDVWLALYSPGMPLWAEFTVVFFAVPTLFAWIVRRLRWTGLLLPALWLAAALAYVHLASRPGFEAATLWQVGVKTRHLIVIGIRFAAACVLFSWVCLHFSPASFLVLPRRMPGLWLLVLISYPLLSAIPQGIVWRVLFVTRYKEMFPNDWSLYAAGALAFACAHLVFRNPITLAATAIGGLLFLQTYLTTGSALLASLEHSAYGLAAFTLGLGRHFYLRANL